MAIYDNIVIINKETSEEDTGNTFLGRDKITILTTEAINEQTSLLIGEQEKWMLETVENEIVKAAKDGKYSTNIIVPAGYDFIPCQQFLIKAGYSVKSTSNSRNLFVSWEPKTN